MNDGFWAVPPADRTTEFGARSRRCRRHYLGPISPQLFGPRNQAPRPSHLGISPKGKLHPLRKGATLAGGGGTGQRWHPPSFQFRLHQGRHHPLMRPMPASSRGVAVGPSGRFVGSGRQRHFPSPTGRAGIAPLPEIVEIRRPAGSGSHKVTPPAFYARGGCLR